MAHQKNEFSYHKIFDNKYSDQSYIAYLTRGKKKYLNRLNSWNDSDNQMNHHVIKPIDFVIRCNNVIHSRKPKKQNIEDIKELYNRKFSVYAYNYLYSQYPITDYLWKLSDEESKDKYVVRIHQIMEDIVKWKNEFENNWDGFRDFIFDSIKFIDDNHLTYIVGDNIAYPRALRDNTIKKYYCLLIGANGYDKFLKYYKGIVSKNIDVKKLVDQISGLLITISDVYNSIISKDKQSSELLKSYLDNNDDMNSCIDIYYQRIYQDLLSFMNKKDKMTMTEQLQFLKNIIINENKKYTKEFVLYENVAIDENSIDDIDFIEID